MGSQVEQGKLQAGLGSLEIEDRKSRKKRWSTTWLGRVARLWLVSRIALLLLGEALARITTSTCKLCRFVTLVSDWKKDL